MEDTLDQTPSFVLGAGTHEELTFRDVALQMLKANFVLSFDDFLRYDDFPASMAVKFEFTVKKTSLARLKYWLFCKFFPFRIERWD